MSEAARSSVPDTQTLFLTTLQIIVQKPGSESWYPRFHIDGSRTLSAFYTAYGDRTTRFVRNEYVQEAFNIPDDYEAALQDERQPREDFQNSFVKKLIFPKEKIEYAPENAVMLFFGSHTSEAFRDSGLNITGKPIIHASPDFTEKPLQNIRIGIAAGYMIKNSSQ